MDVLDQNIIKILQADGRASNASIARSVGVSEGTVRRRLKSLVDENMIKVIAAPNLEQMGYNTAALIGLQTDPGSVDLVADALSSLESTHYVAITTGAYDIFAWVGLESPEQLGLFLRSQVGTIPGIRRTETFVNLTIRKRTHGLVI